MTGKKNWIFSEIAQIMLDFLCKVLYTTVPWSADTHGHPPAVQGTKAGIQVNRKAASIRRHGDGRPERGWVRGLVFVRFFAYSFPFSKGKIG